MSIFPRQFARGATSVVLLHMRVDNAASSDLEGECVFEIASPSAVETTLVEPLTVRAESAEDVYVPFVPRRFEVGRYDVNAYYEAEGHSVASETAADDYFEVTERSDPTDSGA